MPPVSPQGSRGGLIAAVIVFTIGFVASTIFAIYYGVALSKEEDVNKAASDRSRIYYLESASPRIDALKLEARSNPNLREHTVLAASMQETEDLAEKMVGKDAATAGAPTDAITQATAAVQAASTKLNGMVLPDDLVGAISKLAEYAANQTDQVANLQKAQTAGAADAAQAIADAQTKVADAQKDVDAANQAKQQALDAVQKANTDYETKAAADNVGMDKERQQFNNALKKQEDTVAQKDQQIALLGTQVDRLSRKLAGTRVPVEDAIMRRSDGRILSVASDDVAYIDLGSGDHIVPGMTFEVYDKNYGVPKTSDGMSPEDMPVGLGSVEVESVDHASSQVRVTLEPNQHITEGDLIANLVYDRNVKYNFYVYGKFDLGQTGHATDQDRDKILALIAHWGGRLQKNINVDTDFVVMGAEPTVEDFTEDQLEDPFFVRKKNDEVADLTAYNDILTKARDLHIPVMNQNRFLYFVGYYNNALR
jgi:hypothetical protein